MVIDYVHVHWCVFVGLCVESTSVCSMMWNVRKTTSRTKKARKTWWSVCTENRTHSGLKVESITTENMKMYFLFDMRKRFFCKVSYHNIFNYWVHVRLLCFEQEQGKTGGAFSLSGMKTKLFGSDTPEQRDQKIKQLEEQIKQTEEEVQTTSHDLQWVISDPVISQKSISCLRSLISH